jgi:hypothetical protein
MPAGDHGGDLRVLLLKTEVEETAGLVIEHEFAWPDEPAMLGEDL